MWPDGENQGDIIDEVGLRLPSGIHWGRTSHTGVLMALVHTADILIPQDQEESPGGKGSPFGFSLVHNVFSILGCSFCHFKAWEPAHCCTRDFRGRLETTMLGSEVGAGRPYPAPQASFLVSLDSS